MKENTILVWGSETRVRHMVEVDGKLVMGSETVERQGIEIDLNKVEETIKKVKGFFQGFLKPVHTKETKRYEVIVK